MLSGPTRVHGRPQPSLGERVAGRRWHPQDPLGAAQVIGPGAGPLSRTWSPRGPSRGTPPSPRYAARPRAAWQDAPPARGHVRRPSTGLRGPGTPKAGVTPITVEHIPRCAPTRGPADPRPRLHSSCCGQPVARRPLTGLKCPATHLHDAVRGLGCRHLHPSPPASETPPFLLSPPDRGPPFTRGSTALPPRPRHKFLLASKAIHLQRSHCNWVEDPSIKYQVPAPPSVQRTTPLLWARKGTTVCPS